MNTVSRISSNPAGAYGDCRAGTMNTVSRTPSHRQGGFSILEILVATVLISSLVASGIYYVNLGDKSSLVSVAAAKTAVAVRFPEALVAVYSRALSLEDTGDTDLIATGSVQEDIPVEWTVAGGDNKPTKSTLQLNLTFDNETEAEIVKDYLVGNQDSLMVSAAALSADNDKMLLVTYKID